MTKISLLDKVRTVGCVVALFAGATYVAAQTPAAQKPAASTAKAVAAADSAFAKEAALGGMLEVELGKLAGQKGANEAVKSFGQRMVTDHGKANDELKSIASSKGITLPTELDAKHKAVLSRMEKLEGAAFDKAYVADMVKDHEKDVAAFQREAKQGKDPELQTFAKNTLPTLEEHLKLARETHTKVMKGGTE